MRLTNTTRETIDVPVKGEARDGHASTDHILPGETKTVNVDPENATVKGLLFAGALVPAASERRAAKE